MKNTFEERLLELRNELDEIDEDICQLIEERLDLCLQIGREKRSMGAPVFDPAREDEVLSLASSKCPKYPSAARDVLRTLIDHSKANQLKLLNIYLIGMPNCGKTRVCGKLASMLRKRGIDLDSVIMHQSKRTIDDIFDNSGEEEFRRLEHHALVSAARSGGLVVATGGGILTYEPNIAVIKNSGVSIFLDRDIERLKNAKTRNRPLIRGGADDVIRLYNERIEQYRANADLTVDPDDPESVQRIIDFYMEKIK